MSILSKIRQTVSTTREAFAEANYLRSARNIPEMRRRLEELQSKDK